MDHGEVGELVEATSPLVTLQSPRGHHCYCEDCEGRGNARWDAFGCVGIKRYRRQGRERFLSTAEIRRLGEVLTRHEADQPQVVAIIRLLLLTGCLKSEIVTLKWPFYREGKLFLPDGKTGSPRSGSRLPRARSSIACPARRPGYSPRRYLHQDRGVAARPRWADPETQGVAPAWGPVVL